MASRSGTSTMRGASVDALADLRERLDGAVGAGSGEGSGAVDPARTADELFTVASLLRAEPALRRIATDVSIDASGKRSLIRSILESKVEGTTMELVEAAVGHRWTTTRDLADALEHLSEVALVKSVGDETERLGDELFALEQLIGAQPELRDALANPVRSVDDKAVLIDTLLDGKVLPATVTLAQQSLAGSYRTVAVALQAYQRVAAAEHDQRVATVRVAHALSDAETDRLAEALGRQYGRALHLNVVVEPELLGGIRVEVGDEVIDGTVVARLDEARRRLAG